MLDRIRKRWEREHRKRSADPSQWRFHKVQWGDFEVSVMPKTGPDGKVTDSNTGVVLIAPFHPAMKACIVVKDGRKVDCDNAALNMHMMGHRLRPWYLKFHAYCLPRTRVPENGRNDAFWEAVKWIETGRKVPRDYAIGEAERMFWCSCSLSCSGCKLLIPGDSEQMVTDQAREYGWKLALEPYRPFCAVCAPPEAKDFPTYEELQAIEVQARGK